MKLAIVVHDYLPAHVGGTEIHAHQVARELVSRGHELTVLATERALDALEGDWRESVHEGVRKLEVIHQREYADVRESFRQSLSGEALNAQLSELSPDVVHFQHLSLWGSRSIRSARDLGARVVVTLNDYHLLCDAAVLLTPEGELCTRSERGECSRCLRRHPLSLDSWPDAAPGLDVEQLWERAARERYEQHREDLLCADVVVTPSRFLAERFLSAGMLEERQVRVLKYGYPGPRHAPRRSDPGAALRVGYVGGIYHSKGVHVLVEAMGQLVGEPAELTIWGALDWFPDYVAQLRSLAQGLPVTFAGSYAPERVDEVLGDFDVLVVPSVWYENLPLTIQEAYRNAVPVVATDLGGMAESVQDGVSGLLFPRADSSALAECLRRLARDRSLLSQLAQGRPHVPEMDEIVDSLEAFYRGD